MADIEKKSFVMYMSWMPMMKAMPAEQLGELMKAVAFYQMGEEYTITDPMVAAIWEMIHTTLEEDRIKYEETCQARAEAGKRGATSKHGSKQNKQMPDLPQTELAKVANARFATNDSGKDKQTVANANDNESDSESESDSLKDKHICPAEPDASRSSDQQQEEVNRQIHEIVAFLNSEAGTRYKPNADSTRRKISARLREGWTVEDFRSVIRKKSKEWLGTDMEQYLRPETLFGSKFESYVNQPEAQARAPSKKNSFTDFDQRSYDFDDLESRLLRAQA